MRKYHQTKVLALLEQAKEAQEKMQYPQAQDFALSACDLIDTEFGSGSETVKLLEDYCNFLFKAHHGENVNEPMTSVLSDAKNSVKAELKPTRAEIVFISHLAAQSVYLPH